jgi:hypothetical protein
VHRRDTSHAPAGDGPEPVAKVNEVAGLLLRLSVEVSALS